MVTASKQAYMREWRAVNAERLREYQREYDRTRRDPIKHRERSSQYRQENIEVVREKERLRARATYDARVPYQKAYREANRDAIDARQRAYNEAAKEARAVYFQTWYAANRDLVFENVRRRKMLKAGAAGSHTEVEWRLVLDLYNGRCAYCGSIATCRDHVFPISKGGSDSIDNIVPACGPCNSSKRARYLWEWTR